MQFENPIYLLALAIILLLYYFLRRRVQSLKAVLPSLERSKLLSHFSLSHFYIKKIAILSALMLMLIALVNPYFSSGNEDVTQEGIDIVIAMDVSKSMLAKDIAPDRLTRAKLFVNQLLEQLNGDRIGLVVFAGNAYIQVPLTNDYSIFDLYLSSLEPGMIPAQGTALGDAIETSESLFDKTTQKYRALVLITDGETHDKNALRTAQAAHKKGATIYTIGIGNAKGSPVPTQSGYLKDEKGHTVISALNEKLLKGIAQKGAGKYVNIQEDKNAVKDISRHINNKEGRTFVAVNQARRGSLFPLFVGISIIILLIEHFYPTSKSKLNEK